MTTMPVIDLPGFKIVGQAGAGGLGDVFVAVRESTGGKVAIKLLRDHSNSGDVERRIRREVTALLALKGHPGVVQIEEVLTTRKGPALVMEYAEGGSLHSIIQERGSLTGDETIDVALQVGQLLFDAHPLGIVHRDIKPQNILRTTFGRYKVCDFGIAALTRSPGWAEQTSAISYRYASPEEIDGAQVGPPSDIFSLGVTLLQTRTGATDGVRSGASFGFESGSRLDGELAQQIRAMVDANPLRRPNAAQVVTALTEARAGQRVTGATIDEDVDVTIRKPQLPLAPSPAVTQDGLPSPTTSSNWWE